MVALQLLVVLSPAYRRPPPGTHPSRSHHPALHRRAPPAADLLSMVFRIRHPKPPGAGAPAKGKPCLEHLQPPAPTPLPRPPRPSGAEGAHHTRAAKVLSMVFIFTAPNPLGIQPARTKNHAYLNCYSTEGITGSAGAASTTTDSTLDKLGLPGNAPHHNPPHKGSKSDKHGLSNPPPQTP